MGSNIVCFTGNKVNLCILREDDDALALYTKWLNDPDINIWIGHNYRIDTLSCVTQNFRGHKIPFDYLFNIVTVKDDLLIGICEVKYLPQARSADLSIYIGEKEFLSKGYGSEALNLLIKFCFDELNAHRVGLTVLEDNVRAIQCYKKVGFTFCGTEHDAAFLHGHFTNRLHAEILNPRDSFVQHHE